MPNGPIDAKVCYIPHMYGLSFNKYFHAYDTLCIKVLIPFMLLIPLTKKLLILNVKPVSVSTATLNTPKNTINLSGAMRIDLSFGIAEGWQGSWMATGWESPLGIAIRSQMLNGLDIWDQLQLTGANITFR